MNSYDINARGRSLASALKFNVVIMELGKV